MTNQHDGFVFEEYNKLDTGKIPEWAHSLQSIFEENPSYDKKAVMNYKLENRDGIHGKMQKMGEFYFETGKLILDYCIYDNSFHRADGWVFPILYHLEHGIELHLKAINYCGEEFFVECKGKITKKGHNLAPLVESSKIIIEKIHEIGPGDVTDQMLTAIKVVSNYINNIYDMTDVPTYHRYPVDRKGNEHFYLKETDCISSFEGNAAMHVGFIKNTEINLETLSEQYNTIVSLLDFVYFQLVECIEYLKEARSNY